jgi:hypothetical protein
MQEEEKESVVEFEIKKSMKLNIGDYESLTTEINIKQQILTNNYFKHVEKCNSFTDQLMREQYCKIKNIKLKEDKAENTEAKITGEEDNNVIQ